MIKISSKRIIISLLLIVLIVGAVLLNSVVLKIILFGVALIVISFIAVARYNAKREKLIIDDVEDSSPEKRDTSQEESFSSKESEGAILTDYDIQAKIIEKKITPFVPQDLNDQFRQIALTVIPPTSSVVAQFELVLENILTILKNTFLSHSAILFWFRRENDQIIFHNFVSDEKNIQKIKYQLGTDIISKVIISGKPNYTCNINSNVESDLIKYYQFPIGIKSIAAVPVFLNEKVIGVLAIDSKSEDAYGPETILTLGYFVRTITMLLSIYDQKFNIERVNQKLDSVLELIGNSNRVSNESKLISNLIVMLSKFVEWDLGAIVLIDMTSKKYILKKAFNTSSNKYIGEGLAVDISQDTLVGTSIRTGRSIKLDDTGVKKYFIFSKESVAELNGSLMVIPINSKRGVLGALVFEKIKKRFYTDEDVRSIEKIANYFASQFDNLLDKKILQTYLSIDLETLLLNQKTFEDKVHEELAKFKTTEAHIGLALISVDKADKLIANYSSKVIPKIARHVAEHLTNESEELIYLGRLENLKFGVLFVNRDSAADNIWCQKILQKISGEPVRYEEKEFAITVSIGYSGGNKIIRAETLFNAAETALNKAILDGGNRIRTTK